MPGSQIKAVIAPLIRSSGRAEILEVGTTAAGPVVVVAWRGPSASLVTPPGWLVAAAKILGGPLLVRVIAEGEDGAGNLIEQSGRGLRATEQIAAGNVARADEDDLI